VNPFRDDPIIVARKAVRDALSALAARPGPMQALAVQRAQLAWSAAKSLRSVAA
jgi:hypothetical protein